jgi:enoyl-CoA hydratase/carnithine racemase
MTQALEETLDDRDIAILALNRPQASNALLDELFCALGESLPDSSADPISE